MLGLGFRVWGLGLIMLLMLKILHDLGILKYHC